MINKIILGTVQFGLDYGINNATGKPNKNDVFKILDFAHAMGIKTLDTAESYGNSSEILGEYLKGGTLFKVMTKFINKGNQSIASHLQQNLSLLNLENIYNFSFHSAQDFFNFKDIEQIYELKKQGLIQNIGVSIYSNDDFLKAIDSKFIDIIQIPFNLLDNYRQKGSLLRDAKAKHKIVHARSVYLQGLFFKEPNFFDHNLKELKSHINQIHNLCKKSKLSIAALSILYPLSIREIDAVIIGVDCLQHLRDLTCALDKTICKEIIDEISSIDVKHLELIDPRNWNKR